MIYKMQHKGPSATENSHSQQRQINENAQDNIGNSNTNVMHLNGYTLSQKSLGESCSMSLKLSV